MQLDSDTWRRIVTQLRVDSASFRCVKPSDHTSGLNKDKRVTDAQFGGAGRTAAHS
jgi:hypothetical protein